MNMNMHIAVRAGMPSPLVGEGSTAGPRKLAWVRGSLPDLTVWIEPLTRRRFATPPSPTRGEGKNPATRIRRSA
jgi:hypothetical protein